MLSDYLILTGTALNYYGAISGLTSILNESPSKGQSSAGTVIFQRLFFVGVGATLGSLYLYLFFKPQYVVPFLGFGASLKYWAYLSAAIAYKHYNFPRAAYIRYGVCNAIVGTCLWAAFAARAMNS
ncbi:hypothetical protein BDV40DRAFT_271151 [Aspergillus tamarii]|uniref:Uncharacterized protein n=1 Tax=Aspergillus tamarii TaxID=41984 RepID=A0A5N6UNG8_ASPTM|nr:hypothetical protein BDV40DRAFT_271151 [Aspergillus tamarii]